MKKILLFSLIFILLFFWSKVGESKKEVRLLCNKTAYQEYYYILSKNESKLTQAAHRKKLADFESEHEAETYNLIFKNDRIYIFSLVEHPHARFLMLDRSTLKLFFKLYYLDERFLFGKKEPKPPTDIKVLSEQIYNQNVVEQCSIIEKKI